MKFELKLVLNRDALARTPFDNQILLWTVELRGCVLGRGSRLAHGTFFITRGGVRGSEHAMAGDKKLVLVHMVLQVAPLFMVPNFHTKSKGQKNLHVPYPHGSIKSYR
jgi:hypothetical protein